MAKRLVGNEMRLEVWERHGSGCNAVVCRSKQAGGCATDVRKWRYMMRAFGKWREVGLIMALSHNGLAAAEVLKCPTRVL